MSITPLERAIALVKQGKRAEAQKLLKQLIADDQHSLNAWLWLVETCTTNKQRINILEMCLEFNPDNQQVKQALEKLRALSSAQMVATLPTYVNKRAQEKSEGKYKSLIKLSFVSALILVAINYLLRELFSQTEGSYFLFLLFVLPLTPLLSIPATAIVYSIYSARYKGVFFVVGIGIPLIFNVLGASIFIIPSLANRLMHPPADVNLTGKYSDKLSTLQSPADLSLTGKYSDKLGIVGGESSLDVSVGITTSQAGDFTIGAQLIAGSKVISTSNTDVSLVAGDNIVTIQFRGEDIRRFRLDGPYHVKVLPISDWQTGGYIDVTNNTWQTAAYHWRDFGGELCFSLLASIRPDPSVASMEISPAPNCLNGQYLSATRVTLKVTPKSGFQFKGWGGDTGGVDIYSPVITLQMQRDMVANAFFEPNP